MEEVWKDINLASLNDHNTRPISTSFGSGIMFQDFLARPYTNDSSNSSSYSSSASEGGGSLYCAGSPAPQQNALTALSLSSRPPHFLSPSIGPNNKMTVVGESSGRGLVSYFTAPPPPPPPPLPYASSLPCFGSKRLAEAGPTDDGNPAGDRRNKRMIKNRESAARSRARKQAYTNELQLKVDHLLEENARLKRQQQQLCEAATSKQNKKSSLYRTSTAPF